MVFHYTLWISQSMDREKNLLKRLNREEGEGHCSGMGAGLKEFTHGPEGP